MRSETASERTKTLKRWTSAPGHDASYPMQTSRVGLLRVSTLPYQGESAFNHQIVLAIHIFYSRPELLAEMESWETERESDDGIRSVFDGNTLNYTCKSNKYRVERKMRFECNELILSSSSRSLNRNTKLLKRNISSQTYFPLITVTCEM